MSQTETTKHKRNKHNQNETYTPKEMSHSMLTTFDPRVTIKHADDDQDPKNKVFSLVLQRENLKRMQQKVHDPNPEAKTCNVISFIGDTHSGKSFLIRELLKRFPRRNRDKEQTDVESDVQPRVADEDCDEPTSANCNYYLATMKLGGGDNDGGEMIDTIFLDMEGNSGQDYVPGDETNKEVGGLEYYEQRRNSVKQHLPRLAYVTSHLVVYLSELDDSNAKYAKEAVKIASRCALNGVVNAEKPSLLLVHNKVNRMNAAVSVDTSTNKFMEGNKSQMEELGTRYEAVKYVKIPFFDPDDSPKKKEVFEKQMEELTHCMVGMLEKQREIRQPKGTLFSEFSWTVIFAKCVKQLNETGSVRMSSVLASVLAYNEDQSLNKAKYAFSLMTDGRSVVDPETFIIIRRSVLGLLACYLLQTLVSSEVEELSIAALAAKEQLDRRRGEASTIVQKMLSFLRMNEPCESQICNKSTLNQVVSCAQTRCTHGSHHLNTNAQMVGSNMVIRLFRKAVNATYDANWKGGFCWVEREGNITGHFWNVYNEIEDRFKQATANKTQLRTIIAHKQFELLSAGGHTNALSPKELQLTCLLCLRGDVSPVRIQPCKNSRHRLCDECHAGVSTVGVTMLPLDDMCPLCHKKC